MILSKTYECIRNTKDLTGLHITDIYINKPFSGVQLSDGSVGIAMNYSTKSPCVSWENIAIELLGQTRQDPLLEELIYDDSSDALLVYSLRTCIVSALSKPLLVSNPQETFEHFSLSKLISGFESIRVLVVGWGGLMTTFLKEPKVSSVHVTDLLYAHESLKQRFDEVVNRKNYEISNKKFTVSDGSDFKEKVNNCDICVITGSSLCNNTLNKLLEDATKCPIIILQGQSASIYPEYLFKEELVHFLITTVKPDNMLAMAKNNPEKFSRLIEGGLSWINLRPNSSNFV